MAQQLIIRQIFPKESPIQYSQLLNLRNQLLRIPIGLDLFQEDLSQEENHVILAATTTTTTGTNLAKANAKRTYAAAAGAVSSNPKEIDTVKNEGRGGGEEEKAVGCIMLAPIEGDETTLKVRQMAVSPDFQGQGLGSKLVDSAVDFAKKQGKSRLYIHGRVHAVGFYLKKGFTKIREEEFLELGVPHYALEKNLS